MDVSLSFIPDYPKLRTSLYTLNAANVWPILRLRGKLSPQLQPHLSFYHWFCVHLPCCIQVQQTWAVYSYTTCELMLPVDVNFSLILESLLLPIFFQVIFFFFLISLRCLKENPLQESRGKEEERIALSYSLLLTGHSSHCSNSPIKPSGYFLISLDDIQMF